MNSLQDKIYLVQNAITDRQGQTVYFKPNKPNSKSIDDQGGMQARYSISQYCTNCMSHSFGG